MRCATCGEEWDLDSAHEEVSDRNYEEVAALKAKYEGHPNRYRYNDPFQADYEVLFNAVLADFRKRGCVALGGSASYCQPDEQTGQRKQVLTALYDIMGDDCDGMESSVEDAEMMGLL